MDKNSIEKIVEETLKSLDAVKRAEPKPFLFTRVMASINKRSSFQNSWAKLGAFISTPRIAFAGIILIILMNITILFVSSNNTGKPAVVQSNSIVTDEFAINAGNIYEIENLETQ